MVGKNSIQTFEWFSQDCKVCPPRVPILVAGWGHGKVASVVGSITGDRRNVIDLSHRGFMTSSENVHPSHIITKKVFER